MQDKYESNGGLNIVAESTSGEYPVAMTFPSVTGKVLMKIGAALKKKKCYTQVFDVIRHCKHKVQRQIFCLKLK